MTSHVVLTNYPLTGAFRQRLEHHFGNTPGYLHLADLRQLSLREIFRRVRSMRGSVIYIALEDENAAAILSLLKILAGASNADAVELIKSDLSLEPISRWNSFGASVNLVAASGSSYIWMKRSEAELNKLRRLRRIFPKKAHSSQVMYLNANLWFGVKAGGSVGHVAGVANALLRSGFEVDFVSAGGRQLVDDSAAYIPLVPPKTFGMPFETNYYRFSTSVVSQVDRLLKNKAYAFLYQRMSIANYSGVLLSRRHHIPLVMEYNGSEAWVAKNWGRPLRYHDNAVLAEDVCLRHAHVVVTISDALRSELISRGVEPSRIVCYPNCIDPKTFDPDNITGSEKDSVRDHLGISRDAVVAEFIGTFGQWHGVDFLAQAIRYLAENEPDWLRKYRLHFLIVGDGSRMREVVQILGSTACAPFYTLTGLIPQQEAPKYLAAGDVLLSPHVRNADGSPFFGSPTKLFEYMAMGKAILASDLDQIGSVLAKSVRARELPTRTPQKSDEQLAVLFEPGDVQELIIGLKFLVENPAWRTTLGVNARREVLARYTWWHHVTAIVDKLRELELLS